MIFKNITFFNDAFEKETADIEIENGIIKEIGVINRPGQDMSGATMLPGFIDIHIHGGAGGDFCDAKKESLNAMSKYLAKCGITSFCGTTMTLSHQSLCDIMSTAADFDGKNIGAKLVGINMEGPYIAPSKKGAQNGNFIRPGDVSEFNELMSLSGDKIKLVAIAPESFDSDEFIREISKECTVSIGHTGATEKQAQQAFSSGVCHATHLYNAMTEQLHRSAGVVGAAIDNDNVMCELICDGHHVCPVVIRNTFRALSDNRICVISDSMRAAGLGKGVFEFGGQQVIVDDIGNFAHLSDGTLAASVSNIFDEFKNLLFWGIDIKTALKACTINPAKAIHMDDKIGSVAKGKCADFIIVDDDMNIKEVYIDGKIA